MSIIRNVQLSYGQYIKLCHATSYVYSNETFKAQKLCNQCILLTGVHMLELSQ